MRWYRQGSYRDALDYFNRPDDRRRADVTDGGNTLIIYRVRQACGQCKRTRESDIDATFRYYPRIRGRTTVKWRADGAMEEIIEQRSDFIRGNPILIAYAVESIDHFRIE